MRGQSVEIALLGVTWTVYPVSMGNPHGVVFVDDLDEIDLMFWGPRLESAPVWPHGANIEFTQVLDADSLQVRVWERGQDPLWPAGQGLVLRLRSRRNRAVTRDLKAGATTVSLPGGSHHPREKKTGSPCWDRQKESLKDKLTFRG